MELGADVTFEQWLAAQHKGRDTAFGDLAKDVLLTVPPGIAVDLSGIATHGGRVRDHVSRHAVPGAAVTHVITVTGSTHGGRVRVEASGA